MIYIWFNFQKGLNIKNNKIIIVFKNTLMYKNIHYISYIFSNHNKTFISYH